MKEQRASFEQWLDKYEEAYLAPETVARQTCPNCGARTMQLVFVVRGEGDAEGRPAYWCGTCLNGLLLSRISIPRGGTTVADDHPIPNYRIVPPSTSPTRTTP